MPEGIAPWIQPADPASHFIQAFHAGAQVAEARSRLQVQQEESERKSIEAAQQLEVDRAERQQRFDLQQQQLGQAQQRIQMQTTKAAQAFQIQQQGQSRIAAGEDPVQVWSSLGLPAGVSAMSRQNETAAREKAMKERAQIPADAHGQPLTDESGKPIAGFWKVPSATGWHTASEPGYASGQAGERTASRDTLKARLDLLKSQKTDIVKSYGSTGMPDKVPGDPAKAAQWTKDRTSLAAIAEERARIAPPVPPKGSGKAAGTKGGRQFTDGQGRTWTYTGDSTDPAKDKDKSHWQLGDSTPDEAATSQDEE